MRRRCFASLLRSDSDVFAFADKCLRKNPISADSLPAYNREKSAFLVSFSLPVACSALQRQLKGIEVSISELLRVDLSTLGKLLSVFNEKQFYASAMLSLFSNVSKEHVIFAEVIEMVSYGSKLHFNVTDSAPSSSALAKLLGNKGMILGGDYLLSNA